MTKKEQSEVESLRTQLLEARALRFTEIVEPDVAPPKDFNIIVNGWLQHVWDGGWRVDKACTSSIYHNRGGWDKTSSQGSRRLYSTELLAVRAARAMLERECAKKLAAIDREIERLSKES